MIYRRPVPNGIYTASLKPALPVGHKLLIKTAKCNHLLHRVGYKTQDRFHNRPEYRIGEEEMEAIILGSRGQGFSFFPCWIAPGLRLEYIIEDIDGKGGAQRVVTGKIESITELYER